jgi:unsaturated rhamnogalacturonyl hydrolase
MQAKTVRGLLCLLLWAWAVQSQSQSQSQTADRRETPLTFAEIKAAAGSSPADPGPLATDLSPALTRSAIEHAMRKVADWQLTAAEGKYNQDWTYAPLYLGLLAASKATGDAQYHDVVLRQAERFHWKLWADRPFHADDEAIGQVYEALYQEKADPVRIADVRATFDGLLQRPDDPAKDLWWWCDALFMAPPGMAKLSAITGDRRYLETMNAEWALTQQHLYDPAQRLFSRDATFLNKTEPNGQKLFWARGNGWVLAGLADVLQALPANDPARAGYERLFKDMAARMAALQGADGLWRPGLLDAAAYPLPEVSGSAFFTYAMAWGINEGLLPRATYQPVVTRAWRGLLQHVYADGRLGSIQPIGAAPDAFTASSSYVYGVGAFLLAGAELDRGAKAK